MFIVHEGEIVLKEKYGSSSRERFYVRPSEQTNLVVLDETKSNYDWTEWLSKIFLPQGYPDSVSKDYLAYQVWDTAQAFCSTITGTLATQEVLRGVGVGDTSATPLAATVTWVIKDGCGHIGRIVFAYSHGTQLDAYSKMWRLYADTLNDAAMCIEIALPYFKNYTMFALCVSTVMKAIVGVAGGATRVAMTQHHAVRGNLADVSAKDSAQETAVNLVASFTALLIITIIGNSLTMFLLMTVLHIVFNYLAVRAVCLRTFNEPRFLLVIHEYLKNEVIATPCDVNRKEPVIFYQLRPNLLDRQLCGFKIKLGCSIQHVMQYYPEAAYLTKIRDIYIDRSYLLLPNISEREMYVLIKQEATNDDLFCAYFHAVLLSIVTCALNDEPLAIYQNSGNPRPFMELAETLQLAEWSREPTRAVGFSGFVYGPSLDLMKYFDSTVQKEWRRIKPALTRTGWDLSKHLLMVDEWRVCSHTLEAEPIQLPNDHGSGFSESVLQSMPKFVSFHEADMEDKTTFTIEPYMTASMITLLEPIKETNSLETEMEPEKTQSEAMPSTQKSKIKSQTQPETTSEHTETASSSKTTETETKLQSDAMLSTKKSKVKSQTQPETASSSKTTETETKLQPQSKKEGQI